MTGKLDIPGPVVITLTLDPTELARLYAYLKEATGLPPELLALLTLLTPKDRL